MQKPIPTVAEVDAAWDAACERIAAVKLVEDFTIESYPIGSNNRGMCKLEVEFAPKKGYRTKRTTTDKHGRWCKPKCSIYQDHPIFVVAGDIGGREAAWLRFCTRSGPYFQLANGDNELLCEPPCWSKPRRADHHYTITVNGTESEQKTLAADPPELCDAWERWWERYVQVVKLCKAATPESFAVA
jgi:hypothetical protein